MDHRKWYFGNLKGSLFMQIILDHARHVWMTEERYF